MSTQGYALTAKANTSLAPLQTYYNAKRKKHITVASPAGQAWASSNGYTANGETLGYIFTAQEPPAAPGAAEAAPSPLESPPGYFSGSASPHPPPPPPLSGVPAAYTERLVDFARLLASVGINSLVLNNVNACSDGAGSVASSTVQDIAAYIYPIFAQYAVKIYISACFASPQVNGGLPTSDPLDPAVISWWATKADEIYKAIPDFVSGI